MSTLIAERRRALENDDGQESLFGGEAFAPARKAAAWERPARPATPVREDAESAAAPTDNVPCPGLVTNTSAPVPST